MEAQTPPKVELQLTVARLLELSYEKDEGITTRLVKEAGNVRLAVDENGKAQLSGKAGSVQFSADSVTSELGASIRRVKVLMSVTDNGNLRYNSSFDLGYASVNVAGTVDVDEFLRSCSGLMCYAVRLIEGEKRERDRQLRKAIGNWR